MLPARAALPDPGLRFFVAAAPRPADNPRHDRCLAGPPRPDPLLTLPRAEPARAVLAATHVQVRDDWQPVSGRARLVVAGPLEGLHVGDVVEATGWLSAPGEPANPGEWDPAGHYRDDRITALLSVHK